MRLDDEIKAAFERNKGRYGSPRITDHLAKKGAGRQVSVATVARRMQALKLVARPKRKFVSTTSSDHELSVAPNLMDRNFTVEELNTVWVSDITYIRTDDGWRYLTVVLDLADRSKVGIILKEFTPH